MQGVNGKPPASNGESCLCCMKTTLEDWRADYGADGGAAAPRGVVLSFEAKESTKESQRHGNSEGGPLRCALFANIGVPGTAVPGSCICSGLPVANCLRQLCPLGTRSLSAQASACGSPFGAVLGLGSLRSPAGKRLLLPILTAGLAMSRAMKLAVFHIRA